MNQVEGFARPILKPMMRGHSVTLTTEEQTILIAWIVLRGMIFEYSGGQPGARRFYTQDERHTFANIDYEGSLEPLDGTYVWLFHHQSPRWVARSNVANLGLHVSQDPNHLQLITACVGQFGLQLLLGRWPIGRRLELRSPRVTDWHEATCAIWPYTGGSVSWPPRFYLGDDAYEPLCDRFIKGGFPLQQEARSQRS